MADELPKAEIIKRESRYLRGTIAECLADEATGAIADADTNLTKFHGSYQQDDRDVRDERRRQKLEPLYMFMVRLRLPGGVLTPQQWLGLDEVADECANHTLRLTTRQTFQFHGVFKNKLRPLIQKVNKLGIDSRGACGDVNRNVVSNVNPHESQVHAEIHRLSAEISQRLMWRSSAYAEIWLGEECVHRVGEEEEEPFYSYYYLPRKFKIALAVPPENDCDVFANDIGLIAIVESGEIRGFNISVGGGLGTTYGEPETYPRLGRVAGFVPPDQAADACEAITAIQRDFGSRTNRSHARFKYTLDDYGMDWFHEKFAEYRGESMEDARPYHFDNNGDRFGWVEGENGNSHLTLMIQSGRIADFDGYSLRTALREIARVHIGEFRITCNQNLVIANVTPDQKQRIQALVDQYGLDDGSRSSPMKRNAMSCVAFPTCGLAMAESERYLPELTRKLDAMMEEAGIADTQINVRVTGCPNGCARPYVAEIGLTGKALGKYNLYLGGDTKGERMNRLYRENIDEETILSILKPMFERFAAEREDGEGFGDFLVRSGIVDADRSPRVFHEAFVSE
ncbi:assimilatory sulfite reductase (NADPH) hemoprotein subunit [Marinobacter sp. TBZ242]|uniref:Sulfite reductase [NADPH] hemoprotein beta-component n=1 Tax=Marinobacter azerbaijanicus TaxID=3050455 RepID=A0ABT7IGI1_9GAMM|nr:assimilatory sulfite reductase (NADPH) hemoprotein subunit [Marinobacter sp. TBZ242]MDL0433283.1 assimilatory sulfite reductase (NADPH) hemoprotein subunit [Marinobacter sp. TBZ242]